MSWSSIDAQAAAFEQLEHHERHVVLAPVVDRDDVRVVQRRRELGLGAEPAEERGVVGQRRVQHLDRDATPQALVIGDVDATARAGTDGAMQQIAAREHPARRSLPALPGMPTTVAAATRAFASSHELAFAIRRTRRYGARVALRRPQHPERVAIVAVVVIVVVNAGDLRNAGRGARLRAAKARRCDRRGRSAAGREHPSAGGHQRNRARRGTPVSSRRRPADPARPARQSEPRTRSSSSRGRDTTSPRSSPERTMRSFEAWPDNKTYEAGEGRRTSVELLVAVQRRLARSASKPASSRIGTPSCSALVNFEPGLSPNTT